MLQFLLQADFILIANREDIENSNDWNERLLEGLAQCFLKAVARFNSPAASILRYTWLGFIQGISKSDANNFSPLADRILAQLKSTSILESQNGEFVRPVGAYFVPPDFRDADGSFALNCAGDPQKYISANYEVHDRQHLVLKAMGVVELTFANFLTILKSYMADRSEEFRNQNATWHSLVSKILCDYASDTELQSLALISLQDGRWISKVEGQAHFETTESRAAGKIPEGVSELLIVDRMVSQERQRRRLLERLGVKNLNQAEVCRLITQCHKSTEAPAIELDVFISHASYLFEATSAGVFSPKDQNFWVLDRDGHGREAAKMYFDQTDSAHPVGSLLQGTSLSSCLLHPAYLLAYKGKKLEKWTKWLEGHLSIRSSLRIAVRGELTSEFKHIMKSQPSPLVLEILIDSWIKEPNQLTANLKQQIGGMNVLSESGENIHLNKTCLPVPILKHQALPGIFFIQLNLPEKPIWKKLREFGVVVEPNLAFYLKCLSLSQGKQVTNIQMTNLYKNIDCHWIENPRHVEYAHYPPTSEFANAMQ
jgi:hypothetical protein